MRFYLRNFRLTKRLPERINFVSRGSTVYIIYKTPHRHQRVDGPPCENYFGTAFRRFGITTPATALRLVPFLETFTSSSLKSQRTSFIFLFAQMKTKSLLVIFHDVMPKMLTCRNKKLDKKFNRRDGAVVRASTL